VNASEHRTTVVLPGELHERLVEQAEAADRSLSAEVRVAVREHLERSTSSSASARGVRRPPVQLAELGADDEVA